MKVIMLVGLAGADFALAPGDVHECSEAEGARLIAAGFSEPLAPGASPPAAKKALAAKKAPIAS